MSKSRSSSRRIFLRSLSLAPAALLFVGGKSARAQDAAPACPVDTSDGLPGTLQYVDESETADQWCRNCHFWNADETGACGACEMMHRATPGSGHCMSWAPQEEEAAAH